VAKEKCDLSKLRNSSCSWLLVIHERRCGEISPKAVVKFSTNDIRKTIQPAMAESNNAEDHEAVAPPIGLPQDSGQGSLPLNSDTNYDDAKVDDAGADPTAEADASTPPAHGALPTLPGGGPPASPFSQPSTGAGQRPQKAGTVLARRVARALANKKNGYWQTLTLKLKAIIHRSDPKWTAGHLRLTPETDSCMANLQVALPRRVETTAPAAIVEAILQIAKAVVAAQARDDKEQQAARAKAASAPPEQKRTRDQKAQRNKRKRQKRKRRFSQASTDNLLN